MKTSRVIGAKITSGNGGSVLSVFRGGLGITSSLGYSGAISTLACKAEVPSLPLVSLPQYLIRESLFSSAGKLNFGAQDFSSSGKWLSAQIKPLGGQWVEVGRVLLLNQNSQKFTLLNLLDLFNPARQPFELGWGDEIGFAVLGGLSGQDTVNFWGSVVESVESVDAGAAVEKIVSSRERAIVVNDSNTPAYASDYGRSKVVIVNSGAADVYLAYAPTASTASYSELIPPAYRLELEQPEAQLVASAICSSSETSALQITEFWG